MVLEVDLNSPPSESCNEVGTSSRSCGSLGPQSEERGAVGAHGSVQGCPSQLTPIDVGIFDDDVILSSPRAFAEAKNNSRRNRVRRNVIDVDLELISRYIYKRQRVLETQTCNNCSASINPERNSHTDEKSSSNTQPPPPQEPTFSCPVCMGTLVEEMSTKCGHIFCKVCIKQAIAAQGKCPTCRRKVTIRDTIRIYLPSTK